MAIRLGENGTKLYEGGKEKWLSDWGRMGQNCMREEKRSGYQIGGEWDKIVCLLVSKDKLLFLRNVRAVSFEFQSRVVMVCIGVKGISTVAR